MAKNQVTIDVLDKQVQAKLAELQQQAGNIRPALQTVGRTIASRVRLGFRTGISPFGQAWSPLKIRQGQPLRDTGRLASSITYRVGGSGSDQHVDVGTNVDYAPIHQYGGFIKPKTAKYLRFMGSAGVVFSKGVYIPDRPFLPIKGDTFELPQPWGLAVLKALRNHFEKVTA